MVIEKFLILQGKAGANVLYFGCQRKEKDF
jgi:hypothetical protein